MEELATDLYAETAMELAAAIAQAARDLGQTPPPIGFYHASPAH